MTGSHWSAGLLSDVTGLSVTSTLLSARLSLAKSQHYRGLETRISDSELHATRECLSVSLCKWEAGVLGHGQLEDAPLFTKSVTIECVNTCLEAKETCPSLMLC